ncbi:hypothetical protein [Aliivibrio wodanis]|uniref:hypothetical protein n=1 Tax=Aliivibrio wodanis TaxID=80852 RepID=UPI00406D0C3E
MQTYAEFRARYGAVRITRELVAQGESGSVNYIADIMVEKQIKARNGKSFKYIKDVAAITNVADNLLRRDFESPVSNQKWVTDCSGLIVPDTSISFSYYVTRGEYEKYT